MQMRIRLCAAVDECMHVRPRAACADPTMDATSTAVRALGMFISVQAVRLLHPIGLPVGRGWWGQPSFMHEPCGEGRHHL